MKGPKTAKKKPALTPKQARPKTTQAFSIDHLEQLLQKFEQQISKHPELFVVPQRNVFDDEPYKTSKSASQTRAQLTTLLGSLYSASKMAESQMNLKKRFSTLDALEIFETDDDEQNLEMLFQLLHSHNESVVDHAQTTSRQYLQNMDQIHIIDPRALKTIKKEVQLPQTSSDDDDDDDDDKDLPEYYVSEEEAMRLLASDDEENVYGDNDFFSDQEDEEEDDEEDEEDDDDDDDDDDDEEGENDAFDSEEDEKRSKKKTKSGKGGKAVDFFNMDDMELFLQEAEEEDEIKKRVEQGRANDDDFEFLEKADVPDLTEDYSEQKRTKVKFDDFFDPLRQPSKDDPDSEFNEMFADSDSDSDEPSGPLSSHEQRQQQMKKKIQKYESQLVGARPWALSGEIQAADRPENSLLEVDLDFEQNLKRPPTVTELVSQDIEALIKRRIKDEVFDDVQRKKRALVSKGQIDEISDKKGESLTTVLEKEFLGKSLSVEENMISQTHGEIATLWKSLSFKLDALSNFNFVPPQAINQPSIKTNNVASIEIEEVTPASTSSGQTLSAEEIFARAKALQGKVERTQREKQAERRKHKRVDKRRKEEFQKVQKESRNSNPNATKDFSTKQALETVFGQKNIKAAESSTKVTSTQLFKQLDQERVVRSAKNKSNE